MAKKPTDNELRNKAQLRTAMSKPVPQRDITAKGGGGRSQSKRKRGTSKSSG